MYLDMYYNSINSGFYGDVIVFYSPQSLLQGTEVGLSHGARVLRARAVRF